MKQLSLFEPVVPQYPFKRVPNKKEADIIKNVFDGRDYIGLFLGDIIELYPHKTDAWAGMPDQIFWTIGASIRQDGKFYCIEAATGNLHLLHQFSLFPKIYKSKP